MTEGLFGQASSAVRVFRHASAPLSYLEAAPDDPRPELPLNVGLHGRGAGGNDLLSLAEAIAPGAVRWVLPNAPQPLFLGGAMQARPLSRRPAPTPGCAADGDSLFQRISDSGH